MIHTFKLYGTRIAVDTQSGAAHLLDEVGFDMIRYLEFPLEKNCLSTLRYDLARYESTDVAQAFENFEKLCADGVFASAVPAAAETSNVSAKAEVTAELTIEYTAARPVFATEVIRAAEEGAKVLNAVCRAGESVSAEDADIVESELERIAKEIAKRRLGKIEGEPFEFIPFFLNTYIDGKGYLRLADVSDIALLDGERDDCKDIIRRKCVECGLMLRFLC